MGMSRVTTRRLMVAAAAAATLSSALPALSQTYPARAIRVVVGYAPGGPVDTAARRIGPYLQRELGQPIVVENRAGASGVVGADVVAKAAPDGYTLLFAASPTRTMAPHLQQAMPFDPLKDYTPISLMVGFATALVVGKEFPVNSVTELVAFARANPDKVTFGSAGVGASNHLSGELLRRMTGARMIHVPYKGNAPALTDVVGGRISFMFNSVGDSVSFVESGRVRALAVTSRTRNRALPNVPTMIEAGLKDFDVTAWYALEGPPALPAPIVARLNAAVRAALADPQLVKQYVDMGYDVIPSTPDELAAKVRSDHALWGDVARGMPKN